MDEEHYKNNFKENIKDSIDENKNFNLYEIEEQSFHINGRPLTFKTGDVAKILGETPAMIRYYCREFEDFIGIEHNPGEHRIFTDREIKYLRYIIYLLKDKNLSVKQAKEFLSTPQGKLMAPIENGEDKLKTFVEMISVQLKEEISNIVRDEVQYAVKEMQQPILTISSALDKNIESDENLTKMVESVVNKTFKDNEEINQKLNEIKTISQTIDNVNNNLSKVDQFIIEYRQKMAQQEVPETKKGFFSRFFGKK